MGFLVVAAVALVAGLAAGLTGFGLALILVPAMLIFYEPTTVVLVSIVLGIFTALTVIADSWKNIRGRTVLSLLPFAFVGLVAGSEILRVVEARYIQLGAGAVVACAALLLIREVRLPGARTRLGTAFAGFTSGTLSTSIGLPGPPIVLFFAARDLPKREFRVSNAAYFLVLNLVGLALLFFRDIAEIGDLPLAALLIPATFVGKALGTALLKRLSEQAFRLIALGVTACTGVLGAMSAAWAML